MKRTFCPQTVLADMQAGTLVLTDPIIDWLCREVLPSIRKNGRYDLPSDFGDEGRAAAHRNRNGPRS
jgi:hypothetical protein